MNKVYNTFFHWSELILTVIECTVAIQKFSSPSPYKRHVQIFLHGHPCTHNCNYYYITEAKYGRLRVSTKIVN